MNDLDLLKRICALPTAPFAEGAVLREALALAKGWNWQTDRDRFGNLLLTPPGRSAPGPRWILAAHTDHPGLVATSQPSPRTVRADFRGGVPTSFVRGGRVVFHAPAGQVRGKVVSCTPSKRRPDFPSAALVEVDGAVPPGTLGMFDLPAARLSGHRFRSRACDDLAGVAAALLAGRELAGRRTRPPVGILFTRAEEDGFVGALAAVEDRSLLRPDDRILALECSAQQPYAPLGGGCVVRVGDKTSVFHSALVAHVSTAAERLAMADKSFLWRRALMPGGTCEATVYDAFGFVAMCVCVPLGHYHNANRRTGRLAAEEIDVRDWRSMVKLLVASVASGGRFDPGNGAVRARVSAGFAGKRRLLLKTAHAGS